MVALYLIWDAQRNIQGRVVSKKYGIDWRRDLKWVMDARESFRFWCKVAGVGIERVQERIRESLTIKGKVRRILFDIKR